RPPRVLVDVHHEMSLMRNESFVPVIGIQAIDDEMEAIALANESDYGLTASIWSRGGTRARDLLQELEAGTVYLNRCDDVEPALAWTGQKHSGLGFTLSRHAMDPFTRLKSYNLRSRR